MRIFGLNIGRAEKRQTTITQNASAEQLAMFFGVGVADLAHVTVAAALQVPAFGAAVSFLSRTLAALPLQAFAQSAGGPVKIDGKLKVIIHEAPNNVWTSFALRQYFWSQIFTVGRGLIWIERGASGTPLALWPFDTTKVTISTDGKGDRTYKLAGKTYASTEVIDVPFLLKSDQVNVYSPVMLGKKVLQLAIALTEYGANFFAGGGMPPLAVEGPLPTTAAQMQKAKEDIIRVVEDAKAKKAQLFPLPPGFKMTPVGFDPQKGQVTEGQRFIIEEIARLFQIPPVFVGDLTHGTFSNTEQQDLHLVKHLIAQWSTALEQEMNLKLFGQLNGRRYVRHNLDGLLRGDFATRMDGLTKSVSGAIRTPNEARSLEELPAIVGGDKLFIQGANVPIVDAGDTNGQI